MAAKALTAVGILGAALPAFAIGLAGSAAADVLPAAIAGPQPCSPNATPTPGTAPLTSQEFGCLEVSFTADNATPKPGDTVDYTLQIKASGNYMYHRWLPIQISDALTDVEMTSAPTLTLSTAGADTQEPRASLEQFGDDYGIWIDEVGGGGMGDGMGGYDPDSFSTLTVTFTAQVNVDAADGVQVDSLVGAPIYAQGPADQAGVQLALAEPLAGCSTTFVPGSSAPENPDLFGQYFGGDWVPDASSTSGPLCASFTVDLGQSVPPTTDEPVPATPVDPAPVTPVVDPTPAAPAVVDPTPAAPSVEPTSITAAGAASPAAVDSGRLATTGGPSTLGVISAVAAALAIPGAVLLVARRRIAQRS